MAAASLLVWPIDPVIEHDESGVAVWLENTGDSAARVQIRVLGWTQKDGADAQEPQSRIVVSPPAAEIRAGQKQLLRLIRTSPVPPGEEQAYRILIDEIPNLKQEATASSTAGQNAGLAFQLRYSVPLFVSGEGVWTRENAQKKRAQATPSQPDLRYSVQSRDGSTFFVVSNSGVAHARLSSVRYVRNGRDALSVPGLWGYVLPGAEMWFEAPAGLQAGGALTAVVNGNRDPQPILPR